MTLSRKQRWFRDAGLWVPSKPSIIRPRSRNLLPGFCSPGVSGDRYPFGTLLFAGSDGNAGTDDPIIMNFFSGGVGAPFTVEVGDLIVAMKGAQGDTFAVPTDNLGNSYSAVRAVTTDGSARGQCFYSRVTAPGTISQLSFDTDGTSIRRALCLLAFAGPFLSSPLDADPANTTGDITSPHTCPASDALAQAIEVVISWGCCTGSSGTSVNLNGMGVGTLGVFTGTSGSGRTNIAMGYTVTSSTGSITHTFTSPEAPVDTVLGTASFMYG